MITESGTGRARSGLSWGLDIDELIQVLADSDFAAAVPPATATATATAAVPPATAAVQEAVVPGVAVPGAAIPEIAAPAGETADQEAADREAAAQEAILDEMLAAQDRGEAPALTAGQLAGRVAERLTPGPGLAALLAAGPVADADYRDLPGMVAGFRRLASWASACELAAVAQMASKAAAEDPKIGVAGNGKPASISRSAAGEVSLALAMTHVTALGWTDLAVTLSWRLRATGQALAAGDIDLPRARLIADATSVLPGDLARAVETRILPGAGQKTTAQLRAALTRAVILADPEGAELRRLEAEQHARVRLYPDPDGTATLTGNSLPAVHAAAAMARIAALARAWKSAGAAGGADRLRAKVFLSLLLGTNPVIPPPQDAPPGRPSSDGGGDPGPPPPEDGDGYQDPPPPEDSDPGPPGPGNAHTAPGPSTRDPGVSSLRSGDDPGPGDADAPAGDGLGSCDAVPPDPGHPAFADRCGPQGAEAAQRGSVLSCPAIPPAVPAGLAGPCAASPAGGMLDLTLPWRTLAAGGPEPGHLGRIGPITSPLAAHLARCAARHSSAQWRVILIDPAGRVLAVTRAVLRRRKAETGGPPGPAPPDVPVSMVGRVTVIVPQQVVRRHCDGDSGRAAPGGRLPNEGRPRGMMLAAVLAAAREGDQQARQHAAADFAAGGCAHQRSTPAYRPAASLREHIAARDRTCRSPGCGQPAWRTDLDHTIPYDQGGRTCNCNLGGACRTHHQLKQAPGWALRQPRPGYFTWTTPAGRTYPVTPGTYLP